MGLSRLYGRRAQVGVVGGRNGDHIIGGKCIKA